MPDVLHCIASLVKISNKFDHISVGYIQKTAQKQPKTVLSAGMKTLKFQNSRTTNYQTLKLDPYVYHLNTFYMPNNEDVFQ